MNFLHVHTAGSDFGVFQDSEIVFTPDNVQTALCRQVPLINDGLAEDTEFFQIVLSGANENVVLGPPAQITIFDQDSESKHAASIYIHQLLRCSLCLSKVPVWAWSWQGTQYRKGLGVLKCV